MVLARIRLEIAVDLISRKNPKPFLSLARGL
jgi:hypothetical protein